jgi:hypothetical protein
MSLTNTPSSSEEEFQFKLNNYKKKYNIPIDNKIPLETKLKTLPPNSGEQIPNSYIININGIYFYSDDMFTFVNHYFTIAKSILREVEDWESGSFRYKIKYTGKVNENIISLAKVQLICSAETLHEVLDLLITGINKFVEKEKQRGERNLNALYAERYNLDQLNIDHNDMLFRYKEYERFK